MMDEVVAGLRASRMGVSHSLFVSKHIRFEAYQWSNVAPHTGGPRNSCAHVPAIQEDSTACQGTLSSSGSESPRLRETVPLATEVATNVSSSSRIRAPALWITDRDAIMSSQFAPTVLPTVPICDLPTHKLVVQRPVRQGRQSHLQEAFASRSHPEPLSDPDW